MPRYGEAAQKSVQRAMHKRKRGTLKSGSGHTVEDRKQAVAIGLSEAREKGAKVPSQRAARKRTSSANGSKRSGGRKAASKKR